MRFLILILALAVHIVCGQYHTSSASAGVNFENIASANAQTVDRPRQRRMYAMCPPNFQCIGQECYSMPDQRSTWLEAHFFCKDKNARLAEPDKYADRKLREFFLKHDGETGDTDPIWIGSTYNHVYNMWQWSFSGRNLTYDAFSKKFFENIKSLDDQCAVYDPQLRYRWSSRNSGDKNRFICQHKMPKVSENNRHKVYHRWNETYPHQLANEVLLEVFDRREKGRYNRRVVPAAGSNEVATKPRNRQNNRPRRPRPTSASLPEQNDVNYEPQRPSTHPNDIQQQQYNPTNEPRVYRPAEMTTGYNQNNNNDNEIRVPQQMTTPVPEKLNKRRRTKFDQKLQKQREKELRRLQRKKERQQKMRQEKEERLKKLRFEKEQRRQKKEERQRQRAEKQKELRQNENYQAVERQQRERQEQHQQQLQQQQQQQQQQQLQHQQQQQNKQQEIDNLRKQQDDENKRNMEDQEEERRRLAYLKTLEEQEEQEKAKKAEIRKLERQRQAEEESKKHEQRMALAESKRKEYEQRLKQAENERARQLAEEQERKRLQDEENRLKLEEEERQKQDELKKQLEEEEERTRLKRLEEERIADEKELARLREEQRKRAEIQRKREEEIARIEEEQRRIEEEEIRIKQELDEVERQAKLQQEIERQRTEEEIRVQEEERKRAEEQVERDRLAKLEQAKHIVESQKDKNQEHVLANVKQRFESLSPELRKEFIRQRKERKRQKQLKLEQKLKEQQA